MKEARFTPRVLMVELESQAKARACYDDPAYVEAMKFAHQASPPELIIIEGNLGTAQGGASSKPLVVDQQHCSVTLGSIDASAVPQSPCLLRRQSCEHTFEIGKRVVPFMRPPESN